jgi:CheY-like chemotaxis protein/HPt (histidine-containing phosphotransfer) domain-containing protein
VPDVVVGDWGRLRQVLLNLVGNAIKFTPQGRVAVRVSTVSRTADRAILHFAVTDTGIGIPAAKRASIFEPFIQADGSVARRYGGTGLGLTISSRLAGLMGGKIWVDSEEGSGSTFHLTACLGLARGEKPVSDRAGPEGAAPGVSRPLRILLAEDNIVNQRVSTAFLQKQGHLVRVVSDGRSALAAIEAEPFDLVLMDVQMPEMDGLEATTAIRRREAALGRHTPILALTAHAMKGDRERCLAAGMDGYLAKPLRADVLRRAIQEAVEEKEEDGKRKEDTKHHTPPDSSFLVPPSSFEEDVFDRSQAMDRIMGNLDLWRDIIKLFLQESTPHLGEVREALARRDVTRLRRAAHRLKGSVVFFSAPAACAAALRLEQIGDNLDGAEEAVADLMREVGRLRNALALELGQEKIEPTPG